jgi:hypothetical protein
VEELHALFEMFQKLQPTLKVFTFLFIVGWGFLKVLREAIAAGTEILQLWEKAKKYIIRKKKN